MADDFDTHLEKIAMNITYDDFVELVLFKRHNEHVMDIKIIDDKIVVWYWLNKGETLLVFISHDTDKDCVEKIYCYGYYSNTLDIEVWSFSDVSLRINVLDYLFEQEFDIRVIPPNLISLKVKIEDELHSLYKTVPHEEYLSNIDGDIYLCLDAEVVLKKYKFYLFYELLNDFWGHNSYSTNIVIDNIDFLRGMNQEQYVLGSIIQEHCKHGLKCIIALWDMDSGFDVLSDSINDLVNDGMVTLELYSKNIFNSNHIRKNSPFHDMENYFKENGFE